MVNVFTVNEKDQQPLLKILSGVTEGIIKSLPGFISANFHLSKDGTKVVNYAQWRSEEDFRAMHRHPDLQDHIHQCRRLASIEQVHCRVAYTAEPV
ncbi:antibiotic biosynthesis monooxygenase family protein [Amycolatopsis decaplanina DSM 44594]|uniref:Antibiotic biosynthesis monooxygenase family protein n=1 Tax=Amycolatopsis decaplanina DSM 44594 TaxID=1284240 RepID=M2Z9N5_9PSEU|nr:antibiotic biosynthesis monooxygenase family protein [Amycolatopsis decaplanina DSM 44594]